MIVDFERLTSLAILLLSLYLFSALIKCIDGFIISGVTQKVTYNMKNKFHKKIKLPLKYYDSILMVRFYPYH